MEFRYDEIDEDVLIIVADGGLNQDTAEAFIENIETLVDSGLRKVVIDCSGLSYISSYGIGVLIRLNRQMRGLGGDVKVASVKGFLAQAIQATRLNKLFDIYADVGQAKLAFRK
jgi:anti-anti-sigma factor